MAGSGENLCLAGGLALNARWSPRSSASSSVFVQPAAGNAGTALGAAWRAWHHSYGRTEPVPMPTLCLGPELRRRGDQAGARELQAAVPLHADRRRVDRHRRVAS